MDLAVFESLGIVFRPFVWVWKRLRMILPFSNQTKSYWTLSDNLERMGWAVQENNPQHFEQELRDLYPRLAKYGLHVPLLDPVRIGEAEYDNTWHGYHLTFIKALRRQVRNDRFDLAQWNVDVERENAKRRNWMQTHTGRSRQDPVDEEASAIVS